MKLLNTLQKMRLLQLTLLTSFTLISTSVFGANYETVPCDETNTHINSITQIRQVEWISQTRQRNYPTKFFALNHGEPAAAPSGIAIVITNSTPAYDPEEETLCRYVPYLSEIKDLSEARATIAGRMIILEVGVTKFNPVTNKFDDTIAVLRVDKTAKQAEKVVSVELRAKF